MDTAELKKLATEQGLHPVLVRLPEDKDESESVARFQGTLDEFWVAAKALGAKAVFLEVLRMDESDFERDVSDEDVPRIDEEDDDSGDDGTLDLVKAVPAISRFRKYVGKDCAFILIAKGGVDEIGLMLTEPWWDEFQEEGDKVVAKWAGEQNERYGEQEAEHEKQNEVLLESLRGLISDRAFCTQRTQAAMMAYALEKFPDLEDLGDQVLKPEIQRLRAKIEAKGLNRKG